jgi:branched-chain amino acid transport system permease protein
MYVAHNLWSFPLWAALLFGVTVCAFAGYLLELMLYRPLFKHNASSGAVLVASLGSFIVIENLLAIIFGDDLLTFSNTLASRVTLGPVAISSVQVVQLIAGLMVIILLWVAFKRFLLFKAVWAMGDEPDLIPVLGLPLMQYRALIFILSAILGGFAGCLVAIDVGIEPHMGMTYLLAAAVAVLAGGVDSYFGWIAGGFILALLQSLVVWKFSSHWIDLATFSILISMLLLRPQGVISQEKRLEEK